MALLCILDDGREDGEWVRLRSDRIIIGRSQGEIVIPHDAMISGRHAELSRRLENGQCHWQLTDMQSTNGTYVRIGTALLKHGQELIIGGRRYCFHTAAGGASVAPAEGDPAPQTPRETTAWQSVAAAQEVPSLVELTARGEGQRYFLTKPENILGRNASTCTLVVTNDALVSPQHARIYRDAKERWHVENTKSLNGTWLRIDQMLLDAACQFRLGEQRFLLRVL